MTSLAALTLLLPPSSGYLFAYTFPLLAVSIALTFAGAFLTLDRTRSFPPSYDAIPADSYTKRSQSRFRWNLQGGVGGLAIGFAFGIHCATFFALMIPNSSNAPPLSSGAFLATWLLSSIPTTYVSARWKLGALAMAGLTGGALFSLAFSIIIHPALLTRVVLVSSGTIIATLATLLPFEKTQHSALRFATASTGAFGLVLSISLLAGIPAWANSWERLWAINGDVWGTSQEKGLSAAFCLFLLLGVAVDWALRRRFGECPDEKWDRYLATYAANLPDRQGNFQPLRSFWDRAFNRAQPIAVDAKDNYKVVDDEATLHEMDSLSHSKYQRQSTDASNPPSYHAHAFDFNPTPTFLKKGRKHSNAKFQVHAGRRRDTVKFNPNDDPLSSDDEDDMKKPSQPWVKSKLPSVSSSDVTPDKKIGSDPSLEYSDFEEDISTARDKAGSTHQDGSQWSPGFIKKSRSTSGSSSNASTAVDPSTSSRTSGRDPRDPQSFLPVPATPSLINALDRVSRAQKDAHGPLKRPGLPPSASSASSGAYGDGLLNPITERSSPEDTAGGQGGRRWDSFWKDVQEAASSHPTR